MFFHLEYGCTTKGTHKKQKRPAKTMQMLYKTTCLPLDEHRFTKTSNKTGQEEFPKGDHSLPRLCCSPALGQRQKHKALLRPVQQSTFPPRASSHAQELHNTKNFTSLAQTFKKIFKIRWLHIVGLKKGGRRQLSPSYPTMIKEQLDILDSGDLGHMKQVTTGQHLGVSEPSEGSVSACQHWQLSALILECRVSTCQQLPVTGAG